MSSVRSTLTYVSYASPREDSGIHARRYDEELKLFEEAEEVGRGALGSDVGFCWMRAMNPGMLSLAEGVG